MARFIRQARRGFTLLEILVAITIFAISVSIVYGLYDSIISVIHNVEENTAMLNRVKVTFERFDDDLTGLYRGKDGYLQGRDINTYSDEPFLEFTSTSHVHFDSAPAPVGVTIIRYYLQQQDDDTFSLLRSDTPVLLGMEQTEVAEGKKFVLCRGLSEISLQYTGADGREDSGWNTAEAEEQDDSRFPRAIGLELLVADLAVDGGEGSRYSTMAYLRPGLLLFGE